MELEHEQFEGAKELAAIGLRIAEGRALIANLDAEREEYLDGREKEAVERIELVLAQSSELLKEIGANHDELVKYRRELDDYCASLRYFNERVSEGHQAFKEYFDRENAKLDEKLKEVAAQRAQAKKELSQISSDRALLKGQQAQLKDDQRLLDDRRATLERGFAELRAKKKS